MAFLKSDCQCNLCKKIRKVYQERNGSLPDPVGELMKRLKHSMAQKRKAS